MAARGKKKSKAKRMVCPKTHRKKKVLSSKGRCYVKTYVKKVVAKRAGGKRKGKGKR